MTILKSPTVKFNRLTALLLVTASAASACSNSGNPVSSDVPNSENPANDMTSLVSAIEPEANIAPVIEEVAVSNNAPAQTINSAVEPTVAEPNVPAETESVESTPTVPMTTVEPQTPISIPVIFDITVPAYQSNELRIELVWDEIMLNAQWVGDEYWTASAEFPTQSTHPLTITFYDNNGAVELAQYTESFSTGSNATESIKITAAQFDADQFDIDGDGVNNLAESIAGTSLIVDEDSLLEIYDIYAINDSSRISIPISFELPLPEERPFFETFLKPYSPEDIVSINNETDIDAQGNGTLRYSYYHPIDQVSYSGTRSNSENSISWEGARGAYDGDYRHSVDFTTTVTVIDDTTREYHEEMTGRNSGTYVYEWETSTQLTGRLIEGTRWCEAVSGTGTKTYRTSPGGQVVDTTFSKELSDTYWRVTSVSNQSNTREYFVRHLKMLYQDSEVGLFICDFVDIE